MARTFQAVVIGVSTGGVQALKTLLGSLPVDFPVPVLIVQHISADAGSGMAKLLDDMCAIRVKEADEQETVSAGTVYLAPANYHLLVEKAGVLALSADPPVSYARPSVDVLFESAAEVFGAGLIAAVLTGANYDGARGVQAVKRHGGLVVVQDPDDATARQMPEAALAATAVDHVAALEAMAPLLLRLVVGKPAAQRRREARHG